MKVAGAETTEILLKLITFTSIQPDKFWNTRICLGDICNGNKPAVLATEEKKS